MMSVNRIKAKGDEVTYTYPVDRKKYNSTWYQKHKEDIKSTRIDCPCGLSYLGTNKSNHSKGRIHQMYLKYTEISAEQKKTE